MIQFYDMFVYFSKWMFPKIGFFSPKWMVKIMENPTKMDDLGVKPPIFGNTQMGWFNQATKSFQGRWQKPELLMRKQMLQAADCWGDLWVGFFRGFFLEFLWGLGKPFSGEATVRLCCGVRKKSMKKLIAI